MTKGEINLLYAELDKLLNDICKFLNEELRNGFISQNGRSIATVLITRSKQQLQTIATTLTMDSSDSTNEPYVDMQGCKVNQDESDHQEVYSDVSLTFDKTSSLAEEDQHISCPYASLPASELKDGRTGYLYRKEKILFFEQQKKVYAAIQQSWFLIYMNEHSLKPCQTFDLTRHEVKPYSTTVKDLKRREETFSLISTLDSKIYQFTALTPKDMMQWVAVINQQCCSSLTRRSLPPVPKNYTSTELRPESNEFMNDYEPLKEYQIKVEKHSQKCPVPLPPRNLSVKKAQQPHPRTSSEDSLSSNYDCVGPGVHNASQDISNSFSEDDSDIHYDNPAELLQQRKPPSNSSEKYPDFHLDKTKVGIPIDQQFRKDDDDEVYDYLQNPDTISSFKSIDLTNNKVPVMQRLPDKRMHNENDTGKPKPFLKPKILSLGYKRKSNI